MIRNNFKQTSNKISDIISGMKSDNGCGTLTIYGVKGRFREYTLEFHEMGGVNYLLVANSNNGRMSGFCVDADDSDCVDYIINDANLWMGIIDDISKVEISKC